MFARRNRRSYLLLAFAAALLVPCGVPDVARADDAETAAGASAAVEARREQLFVAMLNDPTNLDIAFEYAMLSAQLGDYEGAIATLERMLIYAPNLPRLQLELGVLYYRIGATDLARSYLEAARRQNTPPQVEDRVDTFLARLDQQENPLSVSGSVTGGFRYQSNATAAPDQNIVNINGVPIRLDANARAQADGNVFALGDVHFIYDLQNQNDFIEANIVTYNALFFDVTRVNLQLLEGQLGPNFGFGRFGLDGTRLGAYGIAGVTALGSNLYTTQYGAGARFQSRLGGNVLFDSRNEYRAVNYSNSSNYPTVRQQTGGEFATTNTLTASVTPQILLQGTAQARFVYGRNDFNTYDEYALWARGTYYFYLPKLGILSGDSPWSASLAGGGFLRYYDGPDPLLDPDNTEEDDTYWIEAGLEAPLEHGFSTFMTGQLRQQNSNYETRDYFNAILTVGLTKRF